MNRADFEPALRRAGLIDGPLPPAPPDGGPWYLQAVSGFGAWLAALLVLSMLGGLVGDLWSSTGARMLIGGALCAGAAVVARRAQAQAAGAREGAFLAQFMLACALAGIALLGSVVVEHVHGSVRQAGALALLAAVLLAANPERVHRALMAWMLVVSVIAALWLLKLEPLISIGLAAVTAALWLGRRAGPPPACCRSPHPSASRAPACWCCCRRPMSCPPRSRRRHRSRWMQPVPPSCDAPASRSCWRPWASSSRAGWVTKGPGLGAKDPGRVAKGPGRVATGSR
ncbi:MAG TPA: DUF4401 domain-containing protein [Quisquiliibacterium sp.]|nr:DUF4401 domain-containing protein [Quisquiliibacterium sp.]